jgi:hypothetical protein
VHTVLRLSNMKELGLAMNIITKNYSEKVLENFGKKTIQFPCALIIADDHLGFVNHDIVTENEVFLTRGEDGLFDLLTVAEIESRLDAAFEEDFPCNCAVLLTNLSEEDSLVHINQRTFGLVGSSSENEDGISHKVLERDGQLYLALAGVVDNNVTYSPLGLTSESLNRISEAVEIAKEHLAR